MMFDVGFSEMIVIAVVALVVIGPERLPRVARTAGHLLGRLQRYVSEVKADINREMQIEELRRLQSEIQESARKVEQDLTSGLKTVQQSTQEARAELTSELTSPLARAESVPEPLSTGTQSPASAEVNAVGADDKGQRTVR